MQFKYCISELIHSWLHKVKGDKQIAKISIAAPNHHGTENEILLHYICISLVAGKKVTVSAAVSRFSVP